MKANLEDLGIMSVSELMSQPYSARGEAAELLRMAAEMIENGGEQGDFDDSASWRAVDALVILKQLNEAYRLPGIDDRTGRGGKLTIR